MAYTPKQGRLSPAQPAQKVSPAEHSNNDSGISGFVTGKPIMTKTWKDKSIHRSLWKQLSFTQRMKWCSLREREDNWPIVWLLNTNWLSGNDTELAERLGSYRRSNNLMSSNCLNIRNPKKKKKIKGITLGFPAPN